MAGRPKLVRNSKRTDFRIPAPIYEKLEFLSIEKDISITQLIRDILTEYFANRNKNNG